MSANGRQEDIAAPPGLDRNPERMVWDARVEGQTNEEIAATLGISTREVSQMLMAHHESCQKEPTESVSFYRALAVARCERLLRVYLPVGVLKKVVLDRLRCGEAVLEEDVHYPLAVAAFVLNVLRYQSQLLGLTVVSERRTQSLSSHQTLDWLRTQREIIEQIVAEAPRDVTDLPVKQLDGAERSLAEGDLEVSAAVAELGKVSATTAPDDPDDLDIGEIEFPTVTKKGTKPPPDPQVQAEIDHAERRRRFFAGQPDGL